MVQIVLTYLRKLLMELPGQQTNTTASVPVQIELWATVRPPASMAVSDF
jgi:hypothetical protein